MPFNSPFFCLSPGGPLVWGLQRHLKPVGQILIWRADGTFPALQQPYPFKRENNKTTEVRRDISHLFVSFHQCSLKFLVKQLIWNRQNNILNHKIEFTIYIVKVGQYTSSDFTRLYIIFIYHLHKIILLFHCITLTYFCFLGFILSKNIYEMIILTCYFFS